MLGQYDYVFMQPYLVVMSDSWMGLSINKPDLIIKGKSKTQEQTFYNDAARVWNAAPNNIKDCKTIVAVKKHIKTFVKTLPV